MYGILLENLASFVRDKWGEEKWEKIRCTAGINSVAFSTHHVYSETLLQRLAKCACQILEVEENYFFENMGIYFVKYVSQYGYDKVLSVLGRQLRDFLNGLDNLHEYLKFSYPKMRAPSFYCEEETQHGLKLHYRTKRRGGLIFYVMGQIRQVAIQFYNQICDIKLVSERVDGETLHVIFDLSFDNTAFIEAKIYQEVKAANEFDAKLCQFEVILSLFPFCLLFNTNMEIKRTGHAITLILKDLAGQVMTDLFELTRPMVPFCFTEIMQRRNNIFEVITIGPIHDNALSQLSICTSGESLDNMGEGIRLRLRGQMLHMTELKPDMILYLANPVIPDINCLMRAGLYINDLALHDCSRDMVLTGTQLSVELKLALDQEQQKSKKLVKSVKKLDEERRRTDELLYQMIPKQVADQLRNGENPVNTCQTFENVSILFSDIVSFTDICAKISPMQVVTMLNHMYSLFDQLTERNGVYKVETIGDSYMVVSGAPVPNANHAERICEMGMDMIDSCEAIEDPSGSSPCLKIRIGCHSGMVAAGVVGIKMPRYCLFGDAVNTASRMESTSISGKIQISEACKSLLPSIYECELRGSVSVKGKGSMNTYWLINRENRVHLNKNISQTIVWDVPASNKISEEINRSRNIGSFSTTTDSTDNLSTESTPTFFKQDDE